MSCQKQILYFVILNPGLLSVIKPLKAQIRMLEDCEWERCCAGSQESLLQDLVIGNDRLLGLNKAKQLRKSG